MLTAALGGWGGGLQVGREGEVMRVGVLNDSYKLLPELLLLYSTPAAGYDSVY